MFRHKLFANSLFCLSIAITLYAKEPPAQMLVWPPTGTPVLRFSFGKFKELSSIGNLHNYLIDTTAENVWGKKISDATFTLYLFDKNKARIGEGWIMSFELGTSAHDTIELRDGSVLTGDLESVSATEAVVRIGGTVQHLNRNQVKRISLTERDTPQ